MTMHHSPKHDLAMMARAMRQFAAQASALAEVLEQTDPDRIQYTGDLVAGWEAERDEFLDGDIIRPDPKPSALTLTFEGNVQVRLVGTDVELFSQLFKVAP